MTYLQTHTQEKLTEGMSSHHTPAAAATKITTKHINNKKRARGAAKPNQT